MQKTENVASRESEKLSYHAEMKEIDYSLYSNYHYSNEKRQLECYLKINKDISKSNTVSARAEKLSCPLGVGRQF